MIRVGIYGASGYMGGEALRVLREHPEVEIAWATSRSGKPAEEFHRNLYGTGITLVKPDEVTPCEAVFIALPTGNATALAPELLTSGAKIIDLGADFRLMDRTMWTSISGEAGSSSSACSTASGRAARTPVSRT